MAQGDCLGEECVYLLVVAAVSALRSEPRQEFRNGGSASLLHDPPNVWTFH